MKTSILAVVAAAAVASAAVNATCEETHASCLLSVDLLGSLTVDICLVDYEKCHQLDVDDLASKIHLVQTISTITETIQRTITGCPETVKDCPFTKTPLTTEIISVYTTVCDATETELANLSTVTQTSTIIISDCPVEVTACPYRNKPETIVTSFETLTNAPNTLVPATSIDSIVSAIETAAVIPPPSSIAVAHRPASSVPAAKHVDSGAAKPTNAPAPVKNQTTTNLEVNAAAAAVQMSSIGALVIAAGVAMML